MSVFGIKRVFFGLAGVLLGGTLAVSCFGNIIDQFDPYDSSDKKKIDFRLTNDDNGAIYDSYDFNAFTNVILQLWALSQNQTNYNSISEMLDDWRVTIRSEPTGEIDNKWDGNFDSQGRLFFTHSGLGYDVWYAQQQNPNQNDMFVTVSIPDAQIDGNGNGWNRYDTNDWSLILGTTTKPGMGVAHNGLSTWYADGFEYELVRNTLPEIRGCYTVVLDGEMKLNAWCTNMQEAVGYHVERETTNGWAQITTNVITGSWDAEAYISLVDTGALAGVTTTYRIVVVLDGFGVTNVFSNRVAAVFEVESESVTGITWVAIPGAESYRVEKRVDMMGTWESAGVVATNTYPLPADQSNGFYRVWIE